MITVELSDDQVEEIILAKMREMIVSESVRLKTKRTIYGPEKLNDESRATIQESIDAAKVIARDFSYYDDHLKFISSLETLLESLTPQETET